MVFHKDPFLGPLLFLCYIIGLPKLLGIFKACIYADDANAIISGRDLKLPEIISSNLLNLINIFLSRKNLLLNPNKTQIMFFKTQQSQINIDLNVQLGNQSDRNH